MPNPLGKKEDLGARPLLRAKNLEDVVLLESGGFIATAFLSVPIVIEKIRTVLLKAQLWLLGGCAALPLDDKPDGLILAIQLVTYDPVDLVE
jgi:hypothetical protein